MVIKLKSKTPDIRFLSDMKEVLCDKEWGKKAADDELYYMYRGLKRKKDLRYDITVIPAKMLGCEFNKTKGHKHNARYGELYMVLSGSAIYLMQKIEKGKVKDVFAVRAKKGQAAIVPPLYGHVTINPSKKETLKMANWVAEKCKSAYGPYVKKQGACYYYTKKGWTKNKKYGKIPLLRFERPLRQLPKSLNFLYGN